MRLYGCRRRAPRIVRAFQHHQAFGQGPRLVGAEDVHAPEVLDGCEVTHQHAMASHHLGAPSQVDAQDGGEQLGAQTNRERDREQQRLDGRPAVDDMNDEDEEDHDQHGTRQQLAEAAEAPVEFRFRRPERQPVSDRAKLRPQARGHDQAPRRAASRVGAEEDAIQAVAQSSGEGDGPWSLFNGKALAGQDRFADEEVSGLENHAVRRHQAARGQQHDVARHDLL